MSLSSDSWQTQQLLNGVSEGDDRDLESLLGRHRDFLRRLIEARLEPSLRTRVDPSDVIQETLTVASHRIEDYLARKPTSFRLWLRRKALEQLIDARRRHLAQKRSVAREMHISDASSWAIAKGLRTGHPSEQLKRAELVQQVRNAMQLLSEDDREMLLMRNAEQLSNAEVAELLDISPGAASQRYGRSLRRLSLKLAAMGISGY